jgi:hypothetical protein
VSAAGPESPATADEFAGIPGPRRSRHPVLAAAAVALAAFLMVRVRADVGYALSSATPRDVGDARVLATAADPPLNRFVRLAGPADRESAVTLDTQGSWQFRQFVRLLGTGGRVFVRRAPDPLPVALAERDVFAGRLIRFRDLSFQAAIRGYFLAHVAATHFFRPEDLRAALSGPAGATVADLAGERVELRRDDELAIDTARGDEVQIELPSERAADPARARSLVEEQGGQVVEARTDRGRQVVRARFPAERRDAALSALGDLDRRVHIGPARVTTRARLGELSATGDGLSVRRADGTSALLPAAEIQAVRTMAPVHIPDDALLLIEGETPRDHLRTVLILVLLAGFAALNLLALRRTA